MSKFKNYWQTVFYALVLKGEEGFCKISLKNKSWGHYICWKKFFFLSFDSSSEEERPMDAFYLCCSFKRYSWRKKILGLTILSMLQLIIYCPFNWSKNLKQILTKLKILKKIALAQCKHGKNFLPFIFRLYILRCMTPAVTARGVAERIPSPSTITLIPWGDAFLEDLTKKPRRPLLPPAPLRQKWCSPFQLWLQRISIKCLG